MTLTVRPVKLKQSVYLRVPIGIADLIGIDPDAEVALNLKEQDDQFLLIYTVRKPTIAVAALSSGQSQIVDEKYPAHVAARKN